MLFVKERDALVLKPVVDEMRSKRVCSGARSPRTATSVDKRLGPISMGGSQVGPQNTESEPTSEVRIEPVPAGGRARGYIVLVGLQTRR